MNDDAFPKTVELEEEVDFLGALEATLGAHEALAAGADERVRSPDPEDEVAPEGAEVAGAALGRGGHGVRSGGIDAGFRPQLAVTTAGLVFSGLKPAELREIRVFKAEIVDLLIGGVFLLLVSRIDPAEIVAGGWPLVACVALILLVRPVSVLVRPG